MKQNNIILLSRLIKEYVPLLIEEIEVQEIKIIMFIVDIS